MSEPSALNVATAIVDEWLSWHRDTRPRPTYGFPPKYFAEDLIDAIAVAIDKRDAERNIYLAALKHIIEQEDSDNGIEGCDAADIARDAIVKVENMK